MKMSKVTRALTKTGLFLKKHASTIELVAGIGLIVTGTVIIFKDAEKIADVQRKHRNLKEEIDAVDKEEKEIQDGIREIGGWHDYDDNNIGDNKKVRNKYITANYISLSKEMIKASWKGLLFHTGGMIFIGISHATITRQLEAISASLAATTLSYNQYRERVIADQGKEKDYYYLTGENYIKTVEMKEDGTVVETTTRLDSDPDHVYIPHSFFYTEGCAGYIDNDAEHNFDALQELEFFINKKLEIKGVLSENDIRDIVNTKRTIVGQSAGVFYQNLDGTINHVSFNLDKIKKDAEQGETDHLIVITYDNGKPIESNIYNRAEGKYWELGG